jgi:hypothetical protein
MLVNLYQRAAREFKIADRVELDLRSQGLAPCQRVKG